MPDKESIEAVGRKIGNEVFGDKLTLADFVVPMPGKIAVQVETKAEKTSSGLYIPVETARTVHEQRATQGKIIAIGGEDTEVVDLDDDTTGYLNVGDTVLFGKYTGTKVEWVDPDDRNHREQIIIMQERDVLAILKSPAQGKNLKVKS